jgi:hypothetical protein
LASGPNGSEIDRNAFPADQIPSGWNRQEPKFRNPVIYNHYSSGTDAFRIGFRFSKLLRRPASFFGSVHLLPMLSGEGTSTIRNKSLPYGMRCAGRQGKNEKKRNKKLQFSSFEEGPFIGRFLCEHTTPQMGGSILPAFWKILYFPKPD